ncbi:MAG: ribosome small subunit-dependent GTPase A [Elusimicrobia bacterium]|nr:ribosome small subunit-dependent GTPase A [Elusimicrobiota bacterium]MBD3412436.1 ribosome small subunit-dependent GTPase A [Elusimicrobiota bacterium]
MKRKELGFDSYFETMCREHPDRATHPARVSAVEKDSCVIIGEHGEVQAQVIGRLRYQADSSLDFPTTGDWVLVEYHDDNTLAIIHHILPRKTVLLRKSAGKKIDYQLLGANIDTACIMQSLDADFNRARLDRYLTITREAGIQPVIVLSKSDLVQKKHKTSCLKQVTTAYPDIQTIILSNVTHEGFDSIKKIFKPAHTYCILGSSGVGKSSLINELLGTNKLATREVRKHEHGGKHTTTRRQMIILGNGALCIDTPGMRELGLMSADAGIQEVFPEIIGYAKQCRFPDCSHSHEPGCAVQKALQEGELTEERFISYVKLCKEAAYHSRSYAENRKRDKEFGKMCKSIMKEKNKRRDFK